MDAFHYFFSSAVFADIRNCLTNYFYHLTIKFCARLPWRNNQLPDWRFYDTDTLISHWPKELYQAFLKLSRQDYPCRMM
jgi:hypothetical protein